MASIWPSTEDFWTGRGLRNVGPVSTAGRSSVTCSVMIHRWKRFARRWYQNPSVEPEFHAAEISARHAGTLKSIVHAGVVGAGVRWHAWRADAGRVAE